MNEITAFEVRKLKRRGAIHGYFTRDGVVQIKLGEHDKAIKILHKNHSVSISWIMKRKTKISHDVSQEVNNSVESSY